MTELGRDQGEARARGLRADGRGTFGVRGSLAVVGALLVSVGACSGETVDGGAGDSAVPEGGVCVPNETRICHGPGACEGGQACEADGSGWTPCDFTSEIHFWFEHDSGRSPVIEITGDDDVWVFVDGRLALDLGGIHTPVAGTVRVDELEASLGLGAGERYEVAIFQAERQTTGSTLRLRLTGFDWSALECDGG